MSKIVQIPYDYNIVLPSATAQATQKNTNVGQEDKALSLKALGLLVNLLSYPSTWELHKTELYTRFAKDKRSSILGAWNDLVEANYIIEFKYREGKKYEYVYYLRKVPFTDEEKKSIIDDARREYGKVWAVDFQQSKLSSPKSTPNKENLEKEKNILNKENKIPSFKEKEEKEKVEYIQNNFKPSEINLLHSIKSNTNSKAFNIEFIKAFQEAHNKTFHLQVSAPERKQIILDALSYIENNYVKDKVGLLISKIHNKHVIKISRG